MKAILADNNIQGHVQVIFTVLESESWRELWAEVNLPLATFRDIGLTAEVSDALLWQACQQEQVILITANRNADVPDSLEVTLRTMNRSNQSAGLYGGRCRARHA